MPTKIHERTIVTIFILSLALIGLALVITSTILVGWARDHDNLNQFGLWKFCSSVIKKCFEYQWFQVPEFIIAVRSFAILSCVFGVLLCVYICLTFALRNKYTLIVLRILIAITGFCNVMAFGIYAYNHGFSGGSRIKLHYSYCFVMMCVAFVIYCAQFCLSFLGYLYQDPLRIYSIR